MGIFNRLSRAFSGESTPSRKAPVVVAELAAAFGVLGSLAGDGGAQMDGYVCVPVAGESFYQDALHELQWALDVIERVGYGFIARLIPEPTNPHDANAVAVVHGPAMKKIGYLRADIARDYQAFLCSLEGQVQCPARLAGGTDEKPMIGVVLDFTALAGLKADTERWERGRTAKGAH